MLKVFLENITLDRLDATLIVEGDKDQVFGLVKDFLNKSGVNYVGNPDVCIEEFSTFTVGNAETLVERSNLMSHSNSKTFDIFYCSSMTPEAMNKILKLFEDPKKDKHFILVVPRKTDILPTLLSRATVLTLEGNKIDENAEKFMSMDIASRFEFVVELLDKFEDDEDTGAKRDSIVRMLDSIEIILNQSGGVASNLNSLKLVSKYKDYLRLRGSSPKMLLEHLALILPKIRA